MKKILLIVLSFFSYGILNAQNWQWVKSISGALGESAVSVVADNSGNIYVAGNFNDPSLTIGTTTLTNAGSTDFYIVKFDPSGNVLWAKRGGGTSLEIIFSIAVDVNANIFVTGQMSHTFVLGSDTLANIGSYVTFVAKYDSSGNVLWARNTHQGSTVWFGTTPSAIIADVSGNAIVTGYYSDDSIYVGNFGLHNTVNTAWEEMFIAKYDAMGNVLWAKSYGGIYHDRGNALTVDQSNNIYAAGYFRSLNVFFGTSYVVTHGVDDVFLVKFSPSGNPIWAKDYGGFDMDISSNLVYDGNGHLYLSGYYRSASIAFGTDTIYNSGDTCSVSPLHFCNDIFVAKYDTSGNELWAMSDGGAHQQYIRAMTLDANGDIMIGGSFQNGDMTFASTVFPFAGGVSDFFIGKISSTGNAQWAETIGGNNFDDCLSLCADPSGNIIMCGAYQSASLNFGNITLTNGGQGDGYIAKRDNLPVGVNETSNLTNNISLFPNPATSELTIQNAEFRIEKIEIRDVLGEKVFSQPLTSDTKQVTISVADFSPGIYFITITDQAGNKVTKKIVKM
jgi:hypothetical protein